MKRNKILSCGLTSLTAAATFAIVSGCSTSPVANSGLAGHVVDRGNPAAGAPAQGVENPQTRSIRITTKEITDPDVAVSSDGRWLVFTALGHLFQLPTAGGEAKQLTFGPYYDAAPAISPDGTSVAFISDRENLSQGNVFVLDIASGQIRRITNEFWADPKATTSGSRSVCNYDKRSSW